MTWAASVLEARQNAHAYNDGTTTIYSLPISRCGSTEKLFQAASITEWSVVDTESESVLKEGGPYTGFDSYTIVEELCFPPDGCYVFQIRNATTYEAYWNGKKKLSSDDGIIFGNC